MAKLKNVEITEDGKKVRIAFPAWNIGVQFSSDEAKDVVKELEECIKKVK